MDPKCGGKESKVSMKPRLTIAEAFEIEFEAKARREDSESTNQNDRSLLDTDEFIRETDWEKLLKMW